MISISINRLQLVHPSPIECNLFVFFLVPIFKKTREVEFMSGTKRTNSSSSDFKRIKAKVGKKAKRQHDTDVSFRSASLHIGQSVEENDESDKKDNLQLLLSSRGKSLHHLLSTASKHPASSARVSSLKGVLDIVKRHPTESLSPNLSALIPVCIHSCVDEDKDVRSVGIEALSALLHQLPEQRIQPFGALLVARVSSALHSLDASTRVHGVKMVNLLCMTCSSLATMFVVKLLTPFSDLLADNRTKKATDEILQSLVSLLRVNMARNTAIPGILPNNGLASSSDGVSDVKARINDGEKPDLVYTSGGGARNTIIQTRRSVNILSKNIESLSHLSDRRQFSLNSTHVQKKVVISSRQQSSRDDCFQIKCKSNLISKLRDCLIESINLEHEPTMPSNARVAKSLTIEPQSTVNYPRIILLIRSIRYLTEFNAYHGNNFDTYEIGFDKITQQIASVLMDIFPLDQTSLALRSAKDVSSTSIDHVNAAIAICVLDVSQKNRISNETAETEKMKGWMKTICSYVIPRIRNLTDIKSAASSPDLDMTCKFLRRFGMDSVFPDDINAVLEILQDLFFSSEDPKLVRSIAVRRIAMIIMNLIEFSDFSLTDELKSLKSKVLIQFVLSIPFYLEVWATDFLFESHRLLEGLHKLIRETKGSCDISAVEHIRDNLYKLVSDRGSSLSVFENYPLNLQKMVLGIIVLLGKPCDQTLRHLALICSRSTFKINKLTKSKTASQSIFEAITGIRKTIPMQRYLTFLFQSVGISRHVKEVQRFKTMTTDQDSDSSSKRVFQEVFFTADFSLNRMARALVESGSMKILRMILPQLCAWLHTSLDNVSSTELLLKTRASYIILAYFFLLDESRQGKEVQKGLSIFEVMDGALTIEKICSSIWIFIHGTACEEEAMDFRSKLTSPIVAILSSNRDILNTMILEISNMLGKSDLSEIEDKNIKLILLDWVKDPRLKDSITSLPPSTTVILHRILSDSSDVLLEKHNLSSVVLKQVT